jgi:hypothetical protein
LPLFGNPPGKSETVFRSIAGKPHYYGFLRQKLQGLKHIGEVPLYARQNKLAGGEFRENGRVSGDMEIMYFDPLGFHSADIFDGGTDVLPILPGKAENQVDRDLDAPVPEKPEGGLEFLPPMAPADPAQGLFFGGLKPQFDPDIPVGPNEFRQDQGLLGIDAVGPGRHDEFPKIPPGKTVRIEFPQFLRRSEGIRVGLEI